MPETVLHYDGTAAPREVQLLNKALKEREWLSTDKGTLHATSIFPLDYRPEVERHWALILDAKQRMRDAQGRMFALLNQTSEWRRGQR